MPWLADKYSIKVVNQNEVVVGQVPTEILRYCSFVLNSGGVITVIVTVPKESKQCNRLEVPCRYTIKGPKTILLKSELIIKDIVNRK